MCDDIGLMGLAGCRARTASVYSSCGPSHHWPATLTSTPPPPSVVFNCDLSILSAPPSPALL